MASMFQSGLNEQYVYQKFNHRNMKMIVEMKKKKLMNEIPSHIKPFHDQYKCPICLLTSATKVHRTKLRPK